MSVVFEKQIINHTNFLIVARHCAGHYPSVYRTVSDLAVNLIWQRFPKIMLPKLALNSFKICVAFAIKVFS